MIRTAKKPVMLWVDDERDPPNNTMIVCRSTQEAMRAVAIHGWPDVLDLDHDLGGEDTVMVFLKRLVDEVWDGKSKPPFFCIHSANPVGAENIRAYMRSWVKSWNDPGEMDWGYLASP